MKNNNSEEQRFTDSIEIQEVQDLENSSGDITVQVSNNQGLSQERNQNIDQDNKTSSPIFEGQLQIVERSNSFTQNTVQESNNLPIVEGLSQNQDLRMQSLPEVPQLQMSVWFILHSRNRLFEPEHATSETMINSPNEFDFEYRPPRPFVQEPISPYMPTSSHFYDRDQSSEVPSNPILRALAMNALVPLLAGVILLVLL